MVHVVSDEALAEYAEHWNILEIKDNWETKHIKEAIQIQMIYIYIFSNLFSTRANALLTAWEVPWCWEGLRGGGQVPNTKIHLAHNP